MFNLNFNKMYKGKPTEKLKLMQNLTLALGNPNFTRELCLPPDYVSFKDDTYNVNLYVFLMREIPMEEVNDSIRKDLVVLMAIEQLVKEMSMMPDLNFIKSMTLETVNCDYVGILFSKHDLFN